MINPEILVNTDTARDLALNQYLQWATPLDFIKRTDVHQVRGFVSDPEFLKSVTGKLIVGISRNLTAYDPDQEPDNIYWVGGKAGKTHQKIFANSPLSVLRLLPREIDKDYMYPEIIYKSLAGERLNDEALPSDSLGFLANCYIQTPVVNHQSGNFREGLGHTFGFVCDALGEVSIPVPESGDPHDAVMDNPITPADHLVAFALENTRIAREMLQQIAA